MVKSIFKFLILLLQTFEFYNNIVVFCMWVLYHIVVFVLREDLVIVFSIDLFYFMLCVSTWVHVCVSHVHKSPQRSEKVSSALNLDLCMVMGHQERTEKRVWFSTTGFPKSWFLVSRSLHHQKNPSNSHESSRRRMVRLEIWNTMWKSLFAAQCFS